MDYLKKVALEKGTQNYGCNYLNSFGRERWMRVCQWDCRSLNRGLDGGTCPKDREFCTCTMSKLG